jgi:hypothetical protein
METKEQLISIIRNWVRIDNDIIKLQKEQVKMKNEKKKLSETLIEIMKKNEIDCFDINNGKILYKKENKKRPITKKNLLNILAMYYKEDLLKANEVNEFILNNREEYIKESIVRKQNEIKEI